MRATDFEYRHQTLLHLLTVGFAFLTYVVAPDDIVWALVKHHTGYQALLERLVFGAGAFTIVGAALLGTWASAYREGVAAIPSALRANHRAGRYLQYPLYFGRILFALGLGQLAPALRTVILLAGEMVLILRLLAREHPAASFRQYRWQSLRFLTWFHRQPSAAGTGADWGTAGAPASWQVGLALTMIVFALTLQDRVAEIMAGASFLVWIVLNIPDFVGSGGSRGRA
jgi:hypothetical protein